MLFSTGAVPCRLELPRNQAFELTVDLQANLVPGLYHVETGVWDRARQRIVGSGPSRMLTVQPGISPFGGTVQLNAEMTLRPCGVEQSSQDSVAAVASSPSALAHS
jgi:hypothetical protein